jgi:hypothetical protein
LGQGEEGEQRKKESIKRWQREEAAKRGKEEDILEYLFFRLVLRIIIVPNKTLFWRRQCLDVSLSCCFVNATNNLKVRGKQRDEGGRRGEVPEVYARIGQPKVLVLSSPSMVTIKLQIVEMATCTIATEES